MERTRPISTPSCVSLARHRHFPIRGCVPLRLSPFAARNGVLSQLSQHLSWLLQNCVPARSLAHLCDGVHPSSPEYARAFPSNTMRIRFSPWLPFVSSTSTTKSIADMMASPKCSFIHRWIAGA